MLILIVPRIKGHGQAGEVRRLDSDVALALAGGQRGARKEPDWPTGPRRPPRLLVTVLMEVGSWS
eukprot:3433352-Rhodomonas_salina.1